MKAEKIQGWLAQELGREEIPAPVWEILAYHGYVRDALANEASRARLVERAKVLLLYGEVAEELGATDSISGVSGQASPVDAPRFGDYERDRVGTRAEYLRFWATGNPRVQEFRRKALGGELLSPGSAHDFVRSENAHRPWEGVSLHRDDGVAEGPTGHLEFFRPGSGGDKFGEKERLEFYRGSVLEELHRTAEELSDGSGRLWGEAESAWFVLTGEVPAPKALSGRFVGRSEDRFAAGTIRLEIQPWVSAETVLKAYQYLQLRVLERRVRALSLRNLALARFVMGQLGDVVSEQTVRGKRPRPLSWRKLMERWNEAHPESAYSDERLFYRDFYRAARPVARPYGSAPTVAEIDQSPIELSVPEETDGSA